MQQKIGKHIAFFILLPSIFIFLPAVGFAQQNFFNVPSTNITQKDKIFVQQQFNFSHPDDQSNTTISYGLGHRLEVGVNIFGVNFDNTFNKFDLDPNHQPYSPLYLINVQKSWSINTQWNLGLGTQSGLSNLQHLVAYGYANASYHNEHTHTQWVIGMYSTTNGFFGAETRSFKTNSFLKYIGIQSGIEQNIWKEKFTAQLDFISGLHAMGELVIGGAYYFKPSMVISAGYQIPTFNSISIKALVFEFTYNPSAYTQEIKRRKTHSKV